MKVFKNSFLDDVLPDFVLYIHLSYFVDRAESKAENSSQTFQTRSSFCSPARTSVECGNVSNVCEKIIRDRERVSLFAVAFRGGTGTRDIGESTLTASFLCVTQIYTLNRYFLLSCFLSPHRTSLSSSSLSAAVAE